MGLHVRFVFLRSVRRLLVTANVVPSSPSLVTVMKEALSSSETSVLTRATWHNIPEDAIVYSHRRENLKSYIQMDWYARSHPQSVCSAGRGCPVSPNVSCKISYFINL
jgi:hypothetical protein